MRLWHKDLIPYLPRQQLLGQWRECCAIAKALHDKGTPNHILVNRIMEYPIGHFYCYTVLVHREMERRKYKANQDLIIIPIFNYVNEHKELWNHTMIGDIKKDNLFLDWHNERYLQQCLHNLQEKYDCGAILWDEWQKIIQHWPQFM